MKRVTNKQYWMDPYLMKNLDLVKKKVKEDWDFCIAVDGDEGAGKSVLAQQVGYYLDPTLTLERITFNPRQFKEQVLKSQKYQCVIFDEGMQGLSARGAMTEVNRALVSMLAEIRQKNLFIIIVLPSFFDLDRYVALWRSRCLLHVLTGKRFERGGYVFFGKERKKSLYVQGKRFYSYAKPKGNFTGAFRKFYPIDEKEYKKKKLESLKEEDKGLNKKEAKHLLQRNVAFYALYEDGYTLTEILQKLTAIANKAELQADLPKTIEGISDGIKKIKSQMPFS